MIIGGFIFVLGLIVGSFLNAWQYRIERGITLEGRSFCPQCKRQIGWYDNVPLISWIVLGGKCRKCRKPISLQYPAIELVTATVFLLIWLFSSSGLTLNNWFDGIFSLQFSIYNQFPIIEFLKLFLLFTYFALLILVALHDAKTKFVLTKHTYAALIIGLLYTAINFTGDLSLGTILNYLYPYLLTTMVTAGFFWLIWKASKGKAMGEGDTDIALALGFMLGWPKVITTYYLAFIVAALYGGLLIIRQRGGLKSELPLGPFLIGGGFFGFLYGQQIIEWYAKIFLGI